MLPQMKILSLAFSVACLNRAIAADYGVDVSFPIHGPIKDVTSHFYKRYMESMEGCYQLSSKADCDSTERARIEMNRDQPRTQHNYTEIGFKKTRLPADLFEEILQFYEENKDKKKPERWPPGNTYINNWVSIPYMVSLEEPVSLLIIQRLKIDINCIAVFHNLNLDYSLSVAADSSSKKFGMR